MKNLPWVQILSKNKKKYQIIDSKTNIIIDDINELGNALYIEEACNNYNKALIILKNTINHNNFLKEQYQISPSLILEIKNFLKQIEI